MANKIYVAFVDKQGGTTATSYIGNEGELFYDPTTTTLRVSDGSTPGGTVVSGGGGAANTGEWTFTANDGYNARTDADINVQAVGSGNAAGLLWNLDPEDAGAASSLVLVQSTGLRISNFDGTNPAYELTFDQNGLFSIPANMVMDGNLTGVFRLQPQNNAMTEIFMPADADANTTPLELYAEGNAGIALTGGLRLNPDTVTGASDPLNAIIPKTISIAMLDVPDPSAAQFYLLDGFEGQVLHLIPVSSATGDAGLISLTIDNYRFNSSGTATVESTSGSGNNFYPFSTGTAAMVTMVFASGAWQASQGQWT